MSTHRKISRRTWLKGMAPSRLPLVVPLMLASTAAEAKAIKAAVHYRDYPKWDADVPHVQVLHCGWRRTLRHEAAWAVP